MRLITPRRTSLLALALAVFSQTAWASASANNLECLHTRHSDLANRASCGDKGSLAYCLSQLPAHFADGDLKACFVDAGCKLHEAEVEVRWTLARCSFPVAGDLRRRVGGGGGPQRRADETTTAAAAVTTTTVQNGHATITSNGVTTTVDCMATSTHSTTSCPKQSTGTAAGNALSCFPTTVLTEQCADGLLCDTDDSTGATVCMRKDNGVHAAGTIISLIFAVALTATLGAILYKCCSERRTQKRLVAAAEAAAIARDAREAAAKKRPSVAARSVSEQSTDSQPLMYPSQQGGSGAPQVFVQPHEGDGGYDGVQQYDAHGNPFGDQHRMG